MLADFREVARRRMEAKVIEWQTKLVELSNAKDKVRWGEKGKREKRRSSPPYEKRCQH